MGPRKAWRHSETYVLTGSCNPGLPILYIKEIYISTLNNGSTLYYSPYCLGKKSSRIIATVIIAGNKINFIYMDNFSITSYRQLMKMSGKTLTKQLCCTRSSVFVSILGNQCINFRICIIITATGVRQGNFYSCL